MKYLPLFNLRLTHAYYTDGRCPDFQVEPTPDTRRRLDNYRCVLKAKPDGVQVLAPVTDSGVLFIAMRKDTLFVFHLRLENPDFALFTDLAEITRTSAPLYTNAGLSPEDPVRLALASSPAATGLEKGVFADVEIHANHTLPDIADGPGEFCVSFLSKRARWKYYVIADEAGDGFRIEDGDASPIVFGDENRTDLKQYPDALDGIAGSIAEQYPDKQCVRFVSDEPVPCRQAPRKQIQLRFNGNRVLESLPNPSVRNYTTAEVHTSGTGKQEDMLFHILKYFALSTPRVGG